MVRHQAPGRKERFEAALKLAGMTAEEWGRAPEYGGGVTRQHLYLVLKGERQSPRIVDAVDSFVLSMAPSMAAA
jgi:hypothetical protein